MVAAHRGGRALTSEQVGALDHAMQCLELAEPLTQERRQRVLVSLLDAFHFEQEQHDLEHDLPQHAKKSADRPSKPRQLALRTALVQLERGDPPSLDRWLTQDYLGEDPPEGDKVKDRLSKARSLAAIQILGARRQDVTAPALFECAARSDPQVARLALEALISWHTPTIDRFVLARMQRSSAGGDWRQAQRLARHFADAPLPLQEPDATAFVQHCRKGLIDDDWRNVVRVVDCLDGLPDEWIIPGLIESLAVWIHRRGESRSRLRIETEIIAELEHRSGRSMGPHPERWGIWWSAKRRGLAASADAQPAQLTTRTTFFGIRPTSDRICFVLDASGSMAQDFEGQGQPRSEAPGKRARLPSRYEEAMNQMEAFLRGLGPGARFRVVCFNDGANAWRRELVPVTEQALQEARSWTARQGPGGGTMLRDGIESGLHIDSNGELDWEALEADTLIVLCDGETAEGSGWVEPFFEVAGPLTCVTVHAVQIGGSSDGSLEQMARLTGGDYVQVR